MTASLAVAETGAMPDAGRLATIPAAMRDSVEGGDLAGAVTLVAKEGRILEFDAVGLADLESGRPMTKDTLFWVASMTKPMTAAAILALREEGKLSLADPVEKYLPEFASMWRVAEAAEDRVVLKRPSRAVTIRDLLTHTHGLEEPPKHAPGTPLAEMATAASRGPLQFEPGSQWKYGNAGMNVLGRVVEVVSGQAFPDFLRTRFFDPLGMTQTTFYPDAEQLKKLAKSYVRPDGGGALQETELTLINGDLAARTQSVFPGGGLFSTTMDIFRFYQMLANGGEFEGRRYLSAATVKEMRTPQTGDLAAGFSEGMAWGLGVGIVQNPQGWTDVLPAGTWGHDGAYGTTVMADPHRNLLFILMIQRGGLNPYADGLKFRHAFHSVVMKAFEE